MKFLMLAYICLAATMVAAQDFELSGIQESYRGEIGQTLIAPVVLKNRSDKPVTLVIRRSAGPSQSSPKSYLCLDNHCLEPNDDEMVIKLEPGQIVNSLHVAIEAGFAPGSASIHYLVFNKNAPALTSEFNINVQLEERTNRQHIFSSSDITLVDLYPNPVSDYAYLDYKIHVETVKAKIILHNLLGSVVNEFALSPTETRVKIGTETLDAGIYFYTLYLDNEGMITRKLIVKK